MFQKLLREISWYTGRWGWHLVPSYSHSLRIGVGQQHSLWYHKKTRKTRQG